MNNKTKTENLRNAYKYYLSQNLSGISIQRYLKIVYGFIKFIVRKVLEGWDVHLSGGHSLGVLAIRGNKTEPYLDKEGNIKGVPIAWGKTFELWKQKPELKEQGIVVYCFNEHSNGIRYKWVWLTHKMKLPNKSVYKFSRSRANKRALSKLANEGKEYQISKRRFKKYNNGN